MGNELRVLELFGGIGACSKALERLNIPHKIVDYVEIDASATKSYNAVHGTNFEPQDITKWDKDIEIDMIMHGSPCTNFSLAGRQEGGDEGSGTASSLMYETIRIVKKLRPKYVVWENVKNLLADKHVHNFDNYQITMRREGYNNYYQVLNSKDYGIPQNRERIFTVSIRKDVDDGSFVFPYKQSLKLRLKDMLEKDVDEKYYLNDVKLNQIAHWNAYQKPLEKVLGNNSIVPTLTARGAGEDHSGMLTFSEELDDTTDLQDMYNEENAIKNTNRIKSLFNVGNGKIIAYEGIQQVTVRKYPVNIRELQNLLELSKSSSDISLNDIAEQLGCPVTTVAHWFRKDESFAIPDAQYWYSLKEILNISTDEYDESITTFETRDGVYEKSNRVYDVDGLAPTLTTCNEKILQKCESEPTIKVLGNYMPSGHDASRIVDVDGLAPTVKENHGTVTAIREPNTEKVMRVGEVTPNSQAGQVYSSDGLFPTMCAGTHGYAMGYITEKQDTSDIDNPLKGISGKSWQFEQNVYNEDSRCVRTIKAGEGSGNIPKVILKDSDGINVKAGVAEKLINMNAAHQQDLVQQADGLCRTIPAGTHGSTPHLLKTIVSEQPLRIRKLTPKECWRLMGFDDEDFEKAEKVSSNSQLYKQARKFYSC